MFKTVQANANKLMGNFLVLTLAATAGIIKHGKDLFTILCFLSTIYFVLITPYDFFVAWQCEANHEWAKGAYFTAQTILELLLLRVLLHNWLNA